MNNRRFTTFTSLSVHRLLAVFLGVCLVSIILLYNLTRIQFPKNNEENIHLVYMLGGNTYSRHLFHTHLKSLLASSNSSFHLHVIADSENIEDVQVLLETWKIPRCNYSFYDERDYSQQISWIPSEHYSRQFGYLQLIIPYILPESIDKVISINVDLVFLVDVMELWNMFDGFNGTEFLGMAPTTSNYYTRKHKARIWKAIENGYNSGLQLLDLSKMRLMNWNEKWRNLTETHYSVIKANPLADQDILNTWIFENPSTLYPIPCSYNFELGGNSRPELCPLKPNLIHFNTKDKVLKSELSKYTEMRKVYIDMNGWELKQKRVNGLSVITDKIDKEYRILPNAYGRRNTSELCWGTYFGVLGLESFLENFLENAEKLNIGLSVIVYGSDKEVNILSSRLSSLHRDNLIIHNIFKNSKSPPPETKFLRKLLIDYSNCDQILISDPDFQFSNFSNFSSVIDL